MLVTIVITDKVEGQFIFYPKEENEILKTLQDERAEKLLIFSINAEKLQLLN